MKNIILASLLILVSNFLTAQSLNWNTIEQSNGGQIYLNVGYDFGMVSQLGYAHKLKFKRPIIIQSDFSVPFGKDLNDYKFRLGASMKLIERNNFKTSIQYATILRRYETNLVRQIGLGQLVSLSSGIYKERWHLAFEFGYDSSIATHLKHSEQMQSTFSDIQDAWYKNTGGQWHYGLQGSKKIGEKIELNMRVGATNARGGNVNALLPYYVSFGGVFFLPTSNSSRMN